MPITSADTPRLYVGTYHKYNCGSIKGAWLDLDDYRDKDAFLEACAELHKDEADPELMFQDFESFPRRFYGESFIADELWDWLALDEDDRELLAIYAEHVCDDKPTIEQAKASYIGKYDSPEHWAESTLEEQGDMHDWPDLCRRYFDFKAYAHDEEQGGGVVFIRHDGDLWVFHR